MVVVDDDGATSAPATIQVTVTNAGPQNASLTASSQTAGEGASITFNATVNAPSIDTLSYQWNFGDGITQTTTTSPVTHPYGDNGVYQATVTVTDDDNGTVSSTPVQITITNLPPTASFSANPQNTDENNLTINFDAGASADPGNDALTYSWDFGDGTQESGPAEQVQHTYQDSGSYEVRLIVTDEDNSDSTAFVLTVNIDNVAPTITVLEASVTDITLGSSVDLTADATDPVDSLSYSWTSDQDGTFSSTSGQNVQYTPAISGTVHNITLTVEDGDGGQISQTIPITVNSLVPLGWIGLPFIWHWLRRRRQSGKLNH